MATVAQIKPAQTTAVDDGVRERHGCQSPTGYCDIREDGSHVVVKAAVYSTFWSATEASLTPARARYIARKLYRLARRVEQRELLA